MLQASLQSNIYVAPQAVDFRQGLDGLCGLCRQVLEKNPLDGAFFLFRNRSGTMIRVLVYDGQGFWLCTKRFSRGKIRWWPQTGGNSHRLSLREFQVLLWNGDPEKISFQDDWKPVHPPVRQAS